MTIFYLIANVKGQNTGRGGSFFSSASVAKAMCEKNQVRFFVIGNHKSAAVNNIFGEDYTFLNTSSFWSALHSIYLYIRLLLKYKPLVVHTFTTKLKLFGELANLLVRAKVVFTKCGGKNPNLKGPYYSNIITISRENYDYFSNFVGQNKAIKTLGYIPQRILPFSQNEILIQRIKSLIDYKEEDFIILRIGRIDNYYKDGVIQALQYYREKRKVNENAKLVLLGHKNNFEIPHEFIDDNLYILNEDEFTKNPKSALSIANIKIANGRTAMESCYIGGKILVPTKKHGLVELNRSTLEDLLFFNFSERTELSKECLNDQTVGNQFENKVFDDHFSVVNAIDNYTEFYSKSYVDKPNFKRFLISIYSFYFIFYKQKQI